MVHGFGIFDLKGSVIARKNIHYNFWSRMIERCYSEKSLKRYPNYKKVKVCDQWKYFSNFYKWSVENYKEGFELDKDLSYINSNVYSPDTCSYVPQELNKCLIYHVKHNFPIGVWYKKPTIKMVNQRKKPFVAELNNKKLGQYETAEEAHLVWQNEKVRYLKELIYKYKHLVDEKVIAGIQQRVYTIENDINNGVQTEFIG